MRIHTTTCEYTQLHVNTHKYMWIHTSTCEYTQLHVNTHKYMWIHTTTCEYTQLHVNTHNYMWIHTTTCEYTQLHVNTHNYMWIHTTTCEYTQLHANTHNYMWIHTTTCEYTQVRVNTHNYMWIHTSTCEYTQVHVNTHNYMWIHSTTCEYTQLHVNTHNYMWIARDYQILRHPRKFRHAPCYQPCPSVGLLSESAICKKCEQYRLELRTAQDSWRTVAYYLGFTVAYYLSASLFQGVILIRFTGWQISCRPRQVGASQCHSNPDLARKEYTSQRSAESRGFSPGTLRKDDRVGSVIRAHGIQLAYAVMMLSSWPC